MILLAGLLIIIWGEPGRCLEEEGGFTFDGDIRHFAVATNTVYVATEEKLYQLNHDLTLVQSLTQRGTLKEGDQTSDQLFSRVSETDRWNATFSVNILLPFVENEILISCGVIECGYCEVLDLNNVSNVLYKEHIQVGSPWSSSASLGFLVDVEQTSTETYILTAIQQDPSKKSSCASGLETVNLHNTNDKQVGGLFSSAGKSTVTVIGLIKGNVEFVDGFQIHSVIYLFSNVPSGDTSNRVRLIWLEAKTSKKDTLKSLRGATLSISGGGGTGSRLLASSVIPGGPPVLWSGVFSVDGGQTNTELLLFDISPDLTGDADADPDFCSACPDRPRPTATPKTLKPIAVVSRQNHMTSVVAARQKAWMVFFIGTGDGQLIKLAVDKNYHSTCPKVLYRASDDRYVFSKMHLDQVDLKHVYVLFQNQMKRVPVSKCSMYTNVQDCWSAQDPYCVWCGSKTSCTFEDDCQDSDWLSIPADSQQKMVSHKVVKESTGQISLNIHTHLTAGPAALSNFACQFRISNEICSKESPPPQFPQCTCILSNSTFPAEGLRVAVKVRLGTTHLLEQLKLFDCSEIRGPPTSVLCRQCIEAGCGWSKNSCSWANRGVMKDSVCQMVESGMNYFRPAISSITPSVVSIYGRNHAVLSGRNLSDVTAVRTQVDVDCTPQESPVWNNIGVNLTFHIPSADIKGTAKVCVVLPDGSCHGNATITYQFSPSCTDISPSSAWISGKRTLTLLVSHLEFVEGVVHSNALHKVRLPRYNNDEFLQILTYDTPAAEIGISSSSVFLKVANKTLACPTTVTYYPDPEFTSFTSTRIGNNVRITIEKTADKLEMSPSDLSVWGVEDGKQYPCIMEAKETSNETDFFICDIQRTPSANIQQLMIRYGDKTVTLGPPSLLHQVLLTLRILLIPCVIAALVIVCLWQRKLTADTKKL